MVNEGSGSNLRPIISAVKQAAKLADGIGFPSLVKGIQSAARWTILARALEVRGPVTWAAGFYLQSHSFGFRRAHSDFDFEID